MTGSVGYRGSHALLSNSLHFPLLIPPSWQYSSFNLGGALATDYYLIIRTPWSSSRPCRPHARNWNAIRPTSIDLHCQENEYKGTQLVHSQSSSWVSIKLRPCRTLSSTAWRLRCTPYSTTQTPSIWDSSWPFSDLYLLRAFSLNQPSVLSWWGSLYSPYLCIELSGL